MDYTLAKIRLETTRNSHVGYYLTALAEVKDYSRSQESPLSRRPMLNILITVQTLWLLGYTLQVIK